jgi:hypothetical protein
MEVVGGIYSPNHYSSRCCRWHTGQSGGAPNRALFTVQSCHISRPLGFGAVDRWSLLSSCCTGQSGGTPNMFGTFWLSALTSDCTLFTFCSRPLAHLTVASLAHRTLSGAYRTLSGAYRTVGWIIAERPSVNLRVASSRSAWPGHWTVSGAPLAVPLLVFAPNLVVSPTEFLSWFMLNFITWDKWQLGKLISPCGLWWTSNTKIDYRKCFKPISLSISPFWWLMPTQTKANIKWEM